MAVKTIEWAGDRVRMIDQTLLPLEVNYLELGTLDEMAHAIRTLQVRGAPAIGVAAGMGMVLGMMPHAGLGRDEFFEKLAEAKELLASTRPTAVNLFWALDRMERLALANGDKEPGEIIRAMREESVAILEEDRLMCRRIGEYTEPLIADGATLMTYCNAGGLAASELGTALAGIYVAAERGKTVHVFACETRPLLQGSRLTSWELMEAGIDVTLICDNTAGHVMRTKGVDMIIVGADRVVRNGDVANKIGTYPLAILAEKHGVPFFVAAPLSTIDPDIERGRDIPIEERDPREVTEGLGRRMAPRGIKVFSPAFDVTPNKYIRGIITDRGILGPPFEESITRVLGGSGTG
jgi:methylthioribose-1-phosphate isomerase